MINKDIEDIRIANREDLRMTVLGMAVSSLFLLYCGALFSPGAVVTGTKLLLVFWIGIQSLFSWINGICTSPVRRFVSWCPTVVWLLIVAIIVVDWWVFIPEIRSIVTAYEEKMEPFGRMVHDIARQLTPRHLR